MMTTMMKARQYDRRFFSRDVQPNIGHFQGLSCRAEDFSDPALQSLVKAFENADEYGSLLEIHDLDIEAAANAVDAYTDDFLVGLDTREKLLRMVQLARMMSQKYDVVVTNPPYMGGSGMDNKLSQFVKKKYPDSKSDLSTCFMERCESFCEQYGYFTMINIPVWMFLTSFEDQRKKIVEMDTFSSLLHFGRGIFGADFGTVSFVIRKGRIKNFLSPFLRLFDKPSSVDSLENKKLWFFEKKGLYYIQQESFERISGTPIAYWVSPNMLRAFDLFPSLGKLFVEQFIILLIHKCTVGEDGKENILLFACRLDDVTPQHRFAAGKENKADTQRIGFVKNPQPFLTGKLPDRLRIHCRMIAPGIAPCTVKIAFAGDTCNKKRRYMFPVVLRNSALFGSRTAGGCKFQHKRAFSRILERCLYSLRNNPLHALDHVVLYIKVFLHIITQRSFRQRLLLPEYLRCPVSPCA